MTWRTTMGRAGIAVVLALGCAQIFGIEEACDAADPQCAQSGSVCQTYCNTIMATCSDERSQYKDMAQCLALCPYFPSDTEGDTSRGNSVECRLAIAQNPSEAGDCDVAGRLGKGGCGTSCDSYCFLMSGICPSDYARFSAGDDAQDDLANCQTHCMTLQVRDGLFDARDQGSVDEDDDDDDGNGFANTPSIQCRFWHLAYAVDDNPAINDLHCSHAVAAAHCLGAPVLEAP